MISEKNSILIQENLSHIDKYNEYLFKKIYSFLGDSILDAGSSIGNITQYLINSGKEVCAIDNNSEAIRILKEKFGDKKNIKVKVADLEKDNLAEKLKLTFDTIICLNVLEHLENDELVISKFLTLLKEKGKLILILPAFRFLYGSMDSFDSHFRRYDKKSIKKLLEKQKFRITRLTYFNLPGFFMWFFYGRILKKKIINQSSLRVYNIFVTLVETIDRVCPDYFGQSLLVVAEK